MLMGDILMPQWHKCNVSGGTSIRISVPFFQIALDGSDMRLYHLASKIALLENSHLLMNH